MKRPETSVLIPTRNRVTTLAMLLEALKEQEKGTAFEVIIVDDGSTDGTRDYLVNQSFPFPFRYLRQEHRGPARARNLGLDVATGRRVLFLNDDCIPEPDLIKRHVNYRTDLEPRAVLGHIGWHPGSALSPAVQALAESIYFPYNQIADPDNVDFSYFITGNLSAPLEAVRSAGGFDEDFKEAAFEDVELGYRLMKDGLRLVYDPGAGAQHLHHLTFDDLCEHQQKVAYWLWAFLAKHPEAKDHYRGIGDFSGGFPESDIGALRNIITYFSYRGLRAGRVRFSDRPWEEYLASPPQGGEER